VNLTCLPAFISPSCCSFSLMLIPTIFHTLFQDALINLHRL
jgi:hypothetical protein